MKKILMLGKYGQTAQSLMQQMKLYDFKIYPFDRKELDVRDIKEITKAIDKLKPEFLINTSGVYGNAQTEKNPEEMIEINSTAVGNLAKLCNKYGIKFITFSTNYVFGGEKKKAYVENDPPNPLQQYGKSKLDGELTALNFYPKGTYIIRTSGVYGGKKGSPDKGNFVLNILEEANETKDPIQVSSDQITSTTYANDLSESLLRLLSLNAAPGAYHLINEGYGNWYEFTVEIFRIASIKNELLPVVRGGISGGVKRPDFSALANTKAKKLGIILPHWKKSLKKYMTTVLNY